MKNKVIKLHESWGIMELTWFVFLMMVYTPIYAFRYNHYIATILLLGATLYFSKRELVFPKATKNIILYYAVFTVWVAVSLIWSPPFTDGRQSIIVTMLENCVLLFCAVVYARSQDRLIRLIRIFIYATFIFAALYYGFSPVETWGTTKMGTVFSVWRNAAGYYFMYAAIFAAYLYTVGIKKKHLLIMCAVLILASVGTGSRKVFVQLAFVAVLYVLFQNDLKKKIKIIITMGIVFILAFAVAMQIPAFVDIYAGRLLSIFSGLQSTDASTRTRTWLQIYAMELFTQHPIAGSGVDAFREYLATKTDFLVSYNMSPTYSHCTYTELLANHGIIGFALYYVYPVKQIFSNLKKFDRPMVRLGLMILISFIALDYATISYYMRFYIFILFIGLAAINIEKCDTDKDLSLKGSIPD